jgi:alpha-L-fucosidase 2
LAECGEPLFKMLEELSVSGAEVARKRFGAEGWTLNHNSDLWRRANSVGGQARWAFWPMGGAWLCRHLWEHFAFGGDKEFLKRAWPVMKGAVEFLLSWLQEDGKGGLWSSPSSSPENAFLDGQGRPCTLSAGSAMDMAICRDHLGNCLAAARELGLDPEFQERIAAALKRLPPHQIGARGQLLEWSKDFPEEEPGHRHMSHLYGLHPAAAITPRSTPELAAAAARSLELRLAQGGGHTGWSCAWIVNFFARLGKGAEAWEHLRTLLGRSTHPNFFDVHPPFQIDGNFGGCAGIAEMLLQSHAGEIELLPALPPEWSRGSLRGIRARGGLELDLIWNEGQALRVLLRAKQGGSWSLRHQASSKMIQLAAGETAELLF